MAIVKAIYKNDGERYLGLSTDTKPTDDEVSINSIFEELDTGAIYTYNGTSWTWTGTLKALDHNRMMMGLGQSYQVDAKKAVPQGEALVVRFRPGAVLYHHAEKRSVKCVDNTCEFYIARGFDFAGLTEDALAVNINQKGLTVGGSLASFQSYLTITHADLTTRLSGATILDSDTIYADSTNQTQGSGQAPIISGRHYQPNDDLALIVKNVSAISQPTQAEVVYKYNWHEGQ